MKKTAKTTPNLDVLTLIRRLSVALEDARAAAIPATSEADAAMQAVEGDVDLQALVEKTREAQRVLAKVELAAARLLDVGARATLSQEA